MNVVHIALVGLLVMAIMAAMRFRKTTNRWIVGGSVLSSCALAILTLNAVRNSLSYPGPAHLLLQIGWVALGIGIARDAGRYSHYLRRRVFFDLVMITSATMMMLVSTVLSTHHGPDRALVTLVLLSEVINVTLVGLLYADGRVTGMGVMGLGLALQLASDAVAADAFLEGTTGRPGLRAGLAIAGVLAIVVGLATMRHDSSGEPVSEIEVERLRGLITSVYVGIPLAIVILYAAHGRGINDIWNAGFGFVVVLSYGGREYMRSRQNRRLLMQLSEQALRDPLTELRNRRALAQLMDTVAAERRPVTVVTLDVDRFKEINRQLGHSVGDAVLVRLARLLESRGMGACFRLGGDEFCVVSTLTQSATAVEADALRREAPGVLREVPGVEALAITLSLGMARYQPDGTVSDTMTVLSQSAQALRMAKLDRNRVRVYSEADAANEATRAVLEQRLRASLANGDITFCYQPIVNMDDDRIIGFESLARWTDDELGGVSPAQFVPVAEETGMIHELGLLALRRAVDLCAQLHQAGHDITISVNVSPVQLRRPSFDHDVNEILAQAGCEPSWLVLEVTEGIFMDLDDPAVLTLFRLSSMGISVAIDDFGSGYSSFGYMARLPIRVVKVDRSLVQRVDRPKARSVIEALLTVAETHDLRVIVEGVETADEAHQLQRLGAHIAQGWLWSRGVSADAIPALLLPRQPQPAQS